MNIDKLITDIIPPADYFHRNGFTNKDIIDKLTREERPLVEAKLLEKITATEIRNDNLPLLTLTYMRSQRLIPILREMLPTLPSLSKSFVASSLYILTKDEKLLSIVIESLSAAQHVHTVSLVGHLYHLSPFNLAAAKKFLVPYLEHKDYLVRYNTERILKMIASGESIFDYPGS